MQLTFTPDIFYFKKGEETFSKEFDVVEFARTQRKLKMLMHSLMDESERFLAPYQKLNTISLLSDSDDNKLNDSEYKNIPDMLSDEIDKYLNEIHTEKDVSLLHGIISNSELSNERQSSYLINSKKPEDYHQLNKIENNKDDLRYSRNFLKNEENKIDQIKREIKQIIHNKEMNGCIFQDKNLHGDLNNIYEQDENVSSDQKFKKTDNTSISAFDEDL